MTSSATARSPHDHMPRSRSVCDRSPWRRLSVSSTSWGGFAPRAGFARRRSRGDSFLAGAVGSARNRKTTLATLVAASTGDHFEELSAVTAGIKDVRAVIEAAKRRRELNDTGTVLFIDEVHRFSKTQQDALLPAVENGWVTLIAATTENPSFSVIAPLLSRSLLVPCVRCATKTWK